MKGCSGQCIIGIVVAIIFGALFLYTLISGIQNQWLVRATAATVIVQYILAFVFFAIAKVAKTYAYNCEKCHPPMAEHTHITARPRKRKKR